MEFGYATMTTAVCVKESSTKWAQNTISDDTTKFGKTEMVGQVFAIWSSIMSKLLKHTVSWLIMQPQRADRPKPDT